MTMRRRAVVVAGITAVLGWGQGALAYNSGTEKDPGPENVRESVARGSDGWMRDTSFGSPPGNDNEHGKLLDEAMMLAGLPDILAEDVLLEIYTSSEKTVPGLPPDSSIAPAPFRGPQSADRSTIRTYLIPALAALPDHSYALWDWINGNELCPAATQSSNLVECHTFESHLGALNSSHFGSQARETYVYYHSLALRRAQQCQQLDTSLRSSSLGVDAADFTKAFVTDCEREALVIEAFGQHFIQDAWASGHTWERWGSPDLDDFPTTISGLSVLEIGVDRLALARLVGATSGVIHGVGNKLPHLASRDRLSGGALINTFSSVTEFIGDRFAVELLNRTAPSVLTQYTLQLGCSVAGLREVYGATARASGAMDDADDPSLFVPVSATHASCFEQRAINQSMLDAYGVDLDIGPFVPLNGNLIRLGLIRGFLGASPAVTEKWKLDVNRIYQRLSVLAKLDPEGTLGADMSGFPLLDVNTNSSYGAPGPYADPGIPATGVRSWPAVGPQGETEADAGRWIARVFNKGHLADWCVDSETEPNDLKARVASGPPETRAIACEICTEFASRHVSLGNGEASACGVVSDEPPPITIDAGSFAGSGLSADAVIQNAAASFCGCGLEVVVKTGDQGPDGEPFTSFDSKVSVNTSGQVGFSGFTSSGASAGFRALSPGLVDRLSVLEDGTRGNIGGAAINNSSAPIGIFRRRVNGSPPTFLIEKWSSPSDRTLLGKSSGAFGGTCDSSPLGNVFRAGQVCLSNLDCPAFAIDQLVGFGECLIPPPGPFDSATFFLDINDSGLVAFTGLVNESTNLALFAGRDSSDLRNLLTFSPPNPSVRPQVSNSNEIVFRDGEGNVIVIGPFPSAGVDLIASVSEFTITTDRPGISADGRFVAFGASQSGSPGVFLVRRSAPRRSWKLVGAEGDPNTPEGAFSAFTTSTRYGVAANADGTNITVVFAGTRTYTPAGNGTPITREGIYRMTAYIDPTTDERIVLEAPTTIVEKGAVLALNQKTVSSFDLWDPLSDDGGYTALWVSFSDSTSAIFRQTGQPSGG